MKIMKWICRSIGHRHCITAESFGVAGPLTCSRCGHVRPATEWDGPPMPECKPNKPKLRTYYISIRYPDGTGWRVITTEDDMGTQRGIVGMADYMERRIGHEVVILWWKEIELVPLNDPKPTGPENRTINARGLGS